MEVSRKLEWLEGEWFVPEVPGRGRPIIRLHADPSGRTLLCAFSTREKCDEAIRRWFPGSVVTVEKDPVRMNDEATSKGYTVALDLEDDGKSWKYSNFTRPHFSPGGDA